MSYRKKGEGQEAYLAGLNITQLRIEEKKRQQAGQYASRCPVCQSAYTDSTLKFCLSDGAALVRVNDASPGYDPEATFLYPERGKREIPPTEAYRGKR